MAYKKILLRELMWSDELNFQAWRFVSDYDDYNRIRIHHRRQEYSGKWHDEIMWFGKDGFWWLRKALNKVGESLQTTLGRATPYSF